MITVNHINPQSEEIRHLMDHPASPTLCSHPPPPSPTHHFLLLPSLAALAFLLPTHLFAGADLKRSPCFPLLPKYKYPLSKTAHADSSNDVIGIGYYGVPTRLVFHHHGLSGQLAGEHAGRVRDAERCQQRKLRERQKFFEEAFQQDVEHYLSAGLLYSYTDRQALGSISSMEVNVDLLEQMDILDNSDQEALDVFLNGGADGTSEATGPDSSQGFLMLQAPALFAWLSGLL
uniref:Uncharacterized protein n=1 Tax=Eptatretus burgeri TaxID=7764 RepID=A0A8C4NL58_EPTBU